MTLSNYLYKYSKIYKTDPFISVAIAMQESSLINKNRVESAVVDCKCSKREIKRVITDVGLFQFHVRTIEHEGLDFDRLQTDLEYAVKSHVILLKKKMRLCKRLGIREEESFSCYHSATRKFRKRYVRDVSRYL